MQSHYIEKILNKFDCFDVMLVRTLHDPSMSVKWNNGGNVSQAEYAKIIGSVIYLTNYFKT